MPVVEMTSGNMGAGLAVVCAALGHPLVVTMSAGNSSARAKMLEGLGAEVVLVAQVDGNPGQVTGRDVEAAAEAARQLARKRDGFYVDQFHAAEGIPAHEITGSEILEQFGGPVDGWVAAVGTGCTFMGVAKALKAANPATIVEQSSRWAVVPWQAKLSLRRGICCKVSAMVQSRRTGTQH